MPLVSVSEYARMRGINKSTVSRGLHKHYKNHGTDAKPLIDVDEADAARARLNPLMVRNGASTPVTSDAQAPEVTPPAAAASAAPAPTQGAGYANVASLQKFWQAQRTKTQALKEAGALTPVADVEREQMTVARMWRDRLLAAPRDWAPELYAMTIAGVTENQLRVKLEDLARRLLASFAEEVKAEAEGDEDGHSLDVEPGPSADAAGDDVGEASDLGRVVEGP